MFDPRSPNPGPRLIYSFAKAQIGEDIFVSGDRDGRMEPRDWRGRVAAMVIDLGCLVVGAGLARVMWLVFSYFRLIG